MNFISVRVDKEELLVYVAAFAFYFICLKPDKI